MAVLKSFVDPITPEFQTDPRLPEKKTVTEQDTLRIVIGLLGILLPFILWFGLWITNGHAHTLESISHYYYTRVNPFFSITIGILAMVLIIYKGKKKIDFILSSIAGFFAFCVIFFPTDNLSSSCCNPEFLYSVTYIAPQDLYSTFHFISAGIFLISLALMSLFRFPMDDASNEHPIPRDKFLYRAAGIVMLVALLVIALGKSDILFPEKYFHAPYSGTFWGEAVAVWAFGYSWLLKAGFFTKTYHLLIK
jgi:hypothetical protein